MPSTAAIKDDRANPRRYVRSLVAPSCHDLNSVKLVTPWLDGQSAVYLKAQLQAFASGTRRNDISEQMRNIARQMTPDEMIEAANYYAAQP
jgi:cytochrome c553